MENPWFVIPNSLFYFKIMSKFAVIATGGKQYIVKSGDKLRVEKLPGETGDKLALDKVLLVVDGEKVEVGAPHVSGAKVEAEVMRQFRDKKKLIFKYSSKARFRKRKGHRQEMTEVKIAKV